MKGRFGVYEQRSDGFQIENEPQFSYGEGAGAMIPVVALQYENATGCPERLELPAPRGRQVNCPTSQSDRYEVLLGLTVDN